MCCTTAILYYSKSTAAAVDSLCRLSGMCIFLVLPRAMSLSGEGSQSKKKKKTISNESMSDERKIDQSENCPVLTVYRFSSACM